MKKSLFALAVGIVLAASAATASAQDWHDQDRDHHDQGHDHDRDHGHDRTVVIEHDRGHHEGWYHKGGYVPAEYRDRRYVVEDWRTYRLREPAPHPLGAEPFFIAPIDRAAPRFERAPKKPVPATA
jgi:Ni/Co efflux regulator RcnB